MIIMCFVTHQAGLHRWKVVLHAFSAACAWRQHVMGNAMKLIQGAFHCVLPELAFEGPAKGSGPPPTPPPQAQFLVRS